MRGKSKITEVGLCELKGEREGGGEGEGEGERDETEKERGRESGREDSEKVSLAHKAGSKCEYFFSLKEHH